MTDQTPIERAKAELTRLDLCLPPRDRLPAARAVFDSIDTDQLAKVIEAYKSRGVGSAGIAQTVKNWLTGKDQQ